MSFWGESGRKSTRATCGAVGSYDKQTEKERKAVDNRTPPADCVCMHTNQAAKAVTNAVDIYLATSAASGLPMTHAEFRRHYAASTECRDAIAALVVAQMSATKYAEAAI